MRSEGKRSHGAHPGLFLKWTQAAARREQTRTCADTCIANCVFLTGCAAGHFMCDEGFMGQTGEKRTEWRAGLHSDLETQS